MLIRDEIWRGTFALFRTGKTLGASAAPKTPRQGAVLPGPPVRDERWVENQTCFREIGICRQASSWVKENEKMGDGESKLSPRPIFRFQRCGLRYRSFLSFAAFTATKLVSLVLSLPQRENAPVTASSCYPQLSQRQSCLLWFFLGLQERTPPLPSLLAKPARRIVHE